MRSVFLALLLFMFVLAVAEAAGEGEPNDSRLVKIEKMRVMQEKGKTMLHEESLSAANGSPALAVDALRRQARERMASRLNQIFEDTKRSSVARQKVKDIASIKQRVSKQK